MSDDLTQAWQAALVAPVDELGPWRVLADLLLAEGDLRGEWMQLELDAEGGPLRGLARGRHVQLRHEVFPRLVPPGVGLGDAHAWRGLITRCRVQVSKACQPDDPRWRTVRHLSFFFEPRVNSIEPWRQTPLGGTQLLALDTLAELQVEGTPLLIDGPVLPRLSRVWWTWPLGRPWLRFSVDQFREVWAAVLERQRGIRELHVGWMGSVGAAAPMLEWLLERGLDRIGVEAAESDLPDFDAWVRNTGYRGEFVVELRRTSLRRATVTVGRDELVLRCEPGRVARDALAAVRGSFEAVGRSPAIRVEGPLEGQLPLAPPR